MTSRALGAHCASLYARDVPDFHVDFFWTIEAGCEHIEDSRRLRQIACTTISQVPTWTADSADMTSIVPELWSLSRSTTCHQQHMQKHLCSSMAESERLEIDLYHFVSSMDFYVIYVSSSNFTTWFQCYGSDWRIPKKLCNQQQFPWNSTAFQYRSFVVDQESMPERFPLAGSTASSNVQLWDVAMCRNARGAGAWNRGV